MGTLFLRYSTATLSLDSGGSVALSELDEASRSYWQEWSARSRATPLTIDSSRSRLTARLIPGVAWP